MLFWREQRKQALSCKYSHLSIIPWSLCRLFVPSATFFCSLCRLFMPSFQQKWYPDPWSFSAFVGSGIMNRECRFWVASRFQAGKLVPPTFLFYIRRLFISRSQIFVRIPSPIHLIISSAWVKYQPRSLSFRTSVNIKMPPKTKTTTIRRTPRVPVGPRKTKVPTVRIPKPRRNASGMYS